MYSDPTQIREHVVKLRLNDHEAALIDALVTYTGQQKASILREMIMEQARLVLTGDADFGPFAQQNEGATKAPFASQFVAC